MKKLLLILTCVFFNQSLLSQNKFTGVVVDEKKNFLVGCEVKNTKSGKVERTNSLGQFTIEYTNSDEILTFSLPNYVFEPTKIDDIQNGIIVLPLNESFINLSKANKTLEVSPKNYWIGARVGYNFVSNTDENNFIGSANATINVREFGSKKSLAVIGNIGNYKFNTDEEEANEIQQLAQSSNGISVGLGYIYDNKNITKRLDSLGFTFFTTARVRFNTYKNVGTEKESINLPQFVATGGVEFALAKFKQAGELTLTGSASYLAFDKNQYNLIFGSKKSGLYTLDTTLIIPLKANVGFFVSGTFPEKSSALYTFGIILK